jgi:threonine dehydrogenase-like Zn-dependent dehydrogenase
VAERLSGGADAVIDCVGGRDSLATALAVTRPGGRVTLVGMPAPERIDLTPLWQREIELVGAYAYGTEEIGGSLNGNGHSGHGHGRRVRTFDLAFELVAGARLGQLVSARYPLERYREAIEHAATAGRRGAVKIVFEPKERRG